MPLAESLISLCLHLLIRKIKTMHTLPGRREVQMNHSNKAGGAAPVLLSSNSRCPRGTAKATPQGDRAPLRGKRPGLSHPLSSEPTVTPALAAGQARQGPKRMRKGVRGLGPREGLPAEGTPLRNWCLGLPPAPQSSPSPPGERACASEFPSQLRNLLSEGPRASRATSLSLSQV